MPPSRRRALHLGAVGLAGALAGCVSGALDEDGPDEDSATGTTEAVTTERSSGREATREPTSSERTSADSTTPDPTTQPVSVDTSLPEGSVEFPEGPASPPERPDDLTGERVREYVRTYEHRYVYNGLYYDETSEVQQECGVESVTEYGVGFRVVVRCSAYSNTGGENETTLHADYFTQHATYFVGPDSTVRLEGKSEERE